MKILKEEIRRLERNVEREKHIQNTEYFKNVMLKFLAPPKVNDERQQLMPVLKTMLKLSPEEEELVKNIVNGKDFLEFFLLPHEIYGATMQKKNVFSLFLLIFSKKRQNFRIYTIRRATNGWVDQLFVFEYVVTMFPNENNSISLF